MFAGEGMQEKEIYLTLGTYWINSSCMW